MFSQLGPLFKTTMRQAESADTRLGIRRDEKHEHGKKDHPEKQDEEESPLWNDSTTVSVEALKTFLNEFLKTKGIEHETTSAVITTEESAYKPEPLKPTTTIAARAMKAYGSHADHDPPPPSLSETKAPEEPQDLTALLKTDEVRTMHTLIRELKNLQDRGVDFLTIEKPDTFLEALVIAVETEKKRY